MPRYLTEHFSLDELIASQTAARRGIDNSPPPAVVKNLERLAAVLEEIRSLLGGATILISSGYRCAALNIAIGGAKMSAHMDGLAADFTAPGFGTVLGTARRIATSSVPYDKLIHEYGTWVHVGIAAAGTAPRRQKLSIFGGTGYLDGILSAPA